MGNSAVESKRDAWYDPILKAKSQRECQETENVMQTILMNSVFQIT